MPSVLRSNYVAKWGKNNVPVFQSLREQAGFWLQSPSFLAEMKLAASSKSLLLVTHSPVSAWQKPNLSDKWQSNRYLPNNGLWGLGALRGGIHFALVVLWCKISKLAICKTDLLPSQGRNSEKAVKGLALACLEEEPGNSALGISLTWDPAQHARGGFPASALRRNAHFPPRSLEAEQQDFRDWGFESSPTQGLLL